MQEKGESIDNILENIENDGKMDFKSSDSLSIMISVLVHEIKMM